MALGDGQSPTHEQHSTWRKSRQAKHFLQQEQPVGSMSQSQDRSSVHFETIDAQMDSLHASTETTKSVDKRKSDAAKETKSRLGVVLWNSRNLDHLSLLDRRFSCSICREICDLPCTLTDHLSIELPVAELSAQTVLA